MGDNARLFSLLSFISGLIGIFFIGILAGITAIVFASIAFEMYDDESHEAKAGLVLGLVDICIMGLIIIGVILSSARSGVFYTPVMGFLFLFGPYGFMAMATGGIPIPFMYY